MEFWFHGRAANLANGRMDHGHASHFDFHLERRQLRFLKTAAEAANFPEALQPTRGGT
jgi:hypothetical protein